MKIPEKYEPKTPDEFGAFDRAVTQILSVPASQVQQQIAEKKARRKRAKKRGVSRDAGGQA